MCIFKEVVVQFMSNGAYLLILLFHYFTAIILAVGTACDHLGFSLALDVPTFVVVTKADLCTKQQVQRIHEQLELLLSSAGCKKIPYKVTTESDAYNAAQQFSDK